MARIDPYIYQGPDRKYKPDTANNLDVPNTDNGQVALYRTGYFDLDYLIKLLDYLIQTAGAIYSECETKLSNFALTIDQTDTDLITAQKSAYPDSDYPMVITFGEYKYLLSNSNSNAAQYVMNAYENAVRGASGTNAFDISTVTLMINNEAKRIKEFIDGYIGAVDDTSEFRIIENFQDWGEDTKTLVEQLRSALQGQLSAKLPQSELDTVTSETAPKLQSLLQVKLNAAAKILKDTVGQLLKNWENVSTEFYSKHLGPALQFQLNVGKGLSGQYSQSSAPIISTTVSGALMGLSSNFAVMLNDQLKRNALFYDSVRAVLANIAVRDTNAGQIIQLSGLGKAPKALFTNDAAVTQSATLTSVDHPLSNFNQIPVYSDNLISPHSDLAGTEDDTAHPQYLLRSGGENSTITGDIKLEDGATVDGIVPSKHRHTGTDGSEKIPASSIDFSAFSDTDLDTTTSTTPVPKNLIVGNQLSNIGPTGITTIQLQVEFDMEFVGNVSGYEFEIIELSS